MIEEPIQAVLEAAGSAMSFPTYEIFGLPGFELSTLYKGEQSLYEVRVQAFTFNIASEDVKANSIAEGDTFTVTDEIYVYTFKVSKNPEQDLTGWAVLIVDYIGKV